MEINVIVSLTQWQNEDMENLKKTTTLVSNAHLIDGREFGPHTTNVQTHHPPNVDVSQEQQGWGHREK